MGNLILFSFILNWLKRALKSNGKMHTAHIAALLLKRHARAGSMVRHIAFIAAPLLVEAARQALRARAMLHGFAGTVCCKR